MRGTLYYNDNIEIHLTKNDLKMLNVKSDPKSTLEVYTHLRFDLKNPDSTDSGRGVNIQLEEDVKIYFDILTHLYHISINKNVSDTLYEKRVYETSVLGRLVIHLEDD